MSNLRLADYSKPLKGKTIERCNWHNEPDEDYRCLSILFTDETMVSFRFHALVDEEVEVADFVSGNLSNERTLSPIPLQAQVKPLEGE